MNLKIVVTDDKELEVAVRQALTETGGSCPCSLIQSPDTRCMCKEFRERETPGSCNCGLFVKIEENS